ncbi:LuxR C-terminal-related transcriptional regulator [Streptomyces muensis]|uniref:Response regulator transcription factor n=1 Tax=Streptomyces muensis TaxID=1077944 RepID=A0A9X1TP96_STRM4|nr:response regulator transcription factor [Streptomyces muensis]MCF1597594.1 response regulator transcription factor [Streptomyces muensis]
MVSVLVVNDQSLQRLALRMLLDPEPDLSVVGEAASGAEAVLMSAALRPDVVLMGSHPSRADDDIATVRRIARPRRGPRLLEPAEADAHTPRVLVLTRAGHESYAYAALRAGADGFLLEDAAPDELASAVRVVAAGDAVITPDLTRALIDTVREQRTSRPLPRTSDLATLTGRERDVLTAVASGWSNAEIAERLSIAPTTVKTHVSNILAKIGARARVQAVTFAYESGLVQPAA